MTHRSEPFHPDAARDLAKRLDEEAAWRSTTSDIRELIEEAADLARAHAALGEHVVIVLEEGPESWGATVPSLPGCVAVGDTCEEALRLMSGAIEMHLDESPPS